PHWAHHRRHPARNPRALAPAEDNRPGLPQLHTRRRPPLTQGDSPMPPRAPVPRTLKTAKVKITTKCNRHCDFCIFADGAQGENMPLELFSTILTRLETIPFQQLHINGGEPTVHRDFPALSDAARKRLPDKVMVLGTNAITLARNKRIMEATLRSYDQVLIGCDDEHENYDEVHAVVPRLREAGKTVVINSVLEGISSTRLTQLARLCGTYGAIHVTNHVHHVDVGQPANELRGPCDRYLDQHLLIEMDGS